LSRPRPVLCDGGQLAPGGIVTNTTTQGNQKDQYTFSASAGDYAVLTFVSTGAADPGFNPVIEVHAPSGNYVSSPFYGPIAGYPQQRGPQLRRLRRCLHP